MAKQEKIKVKFCPKCKSFEVGYVFGLSSWLGMSPKMRCKKCKFEMPSFPVLTIDKKTLKKAAINKKEKIIKKSTKKVRSKK
ncbi:hypothetical protein HN604_01555 [archaeon]|jgi:hypothetical protein|nr:hypothetical protein [archaeon]MBT6182685.1 hypothetical protein [archaeon]MBT6606453.1 hypothetical protein [archaeon]MBT7251382.1 hypothetical protein [archaeon]MBT7660749.1 hypothetical protein [archaeon]